MRKPLSQRKSLLLLLSMVAILAAVIAVLAVSLRTDEVADSLEEGKVVKVLLVLHDGDDVLSTDVFMFSPESKKGALFEISGNVGAIYRSLDSAGRKGRVDRIDSVYRERGVDVYRSEIQTLLDRDIPYSIEIDLPEFGLLTDLLGGMKVFIPSPVDALDDDGERWLLPSGAVNLDGAKVQTYVSYLLPDEAEADRSKRRQEVVVSFLTALNENRTTVLGKKNFPTFSSKMKSNVLGDDFRTLVSLVSDIDCSTLTPQSIAGRTETVDGQSLLIPLLEGQTIKEVVKLAESSLRNGSSQSRVYSVDVFNGTSRNGLAGNTAELLRGAGYDILTISNAEESQVYLRYLVKYGDLAEGQPLDGDVDHTLIVNHIGDEQVAETLGEFIRCRNIESEEILADPSDFAGGTDVDFTLILGKDFDGRYVRGGYIRTEE